MQLLISTSSIIAASIIFLLGFFVFINGKRRLLNIAFATHCLSLSVWCFGIYGLVSKVQWALELWLRIMASGVSFIPSTFLFFVLTLVGHRYTYQKWILSGMFTLSAIFFCITHTTTWLYLGVTKVAFGYVGVPGKIFPLYITITVGVMVWSQILIYKCRATSSGPKQKQLQFVYRSLWIFWIGALSVIPTLLGYNILGGFPLWNFSNIVYGICMAYSITKYNLIELEFEVDRQKELVIELQNANYKINQLNNNLKKIVKDQVAELERNREFLEKASDQMALVTFAKGIAHGITNFSIQLVFISTLCRRIVYKIRKLRKNEPLPFLVS